MTNQEDMSGGGEVIELGKYRSEHQPLDTEVSALEREITEAEERLRVSLAEVDEIRQRLIALDEQLRIAKTEAKKMATDDKAGDAEVISLFPKKESPQAQ